jgi:hypothetical protein
VTDREPTHIAPSAWSAWIVVVSGVDQVLLGPGIQNVLDGQSGHVIAGTRLVGVDPHLALNEQRGFATVRPI